MTHLNIVTASWPNECHNFSISCHIHGISQRSCFIALVRVSTLKKQKIDQNVNDVQNSFDGIKLTGD